MKKSQIEVTHKEIRDARSDVVEALGIKRSQTRAEIEDLRSKSSSNYEQQLLAKLVQLTNLYELEKQQTDKIIKVRAVSGFLATKETGIYMLQVKKKKLRKKTKETVCTVKKTVFFVFTIQILFKDDCFLLNRTRVLWR